jgi:hypothetical protein
MMSKGLAAGEIAEQMAVSKNAVVGKMHRLRIKNGHAPQTRKNNMTRTYKGPIIGTRPCNLCSKKFNMHGRFDRFCDPCKRGGLYG